MGSSRRDPRRHSRASSVQSVSPLRMGPEDEDVTPAPSDPINPSKPRGNRYECDYCRRDLTLAIRIRCAECANFDLCVECFSMGVELMTHKNDHQYRVIEHISEPIFDRDWGADEERALLDGIMSCGFGNWQDIAEHVSTKSRQKCQAHYNAVYLSSNTAPLPNGQLILESKDYRKQMPTVPSVDRRLSIMGEADLPSSGNKSGTPSKPPATSNSLKSQDTSLARMVGFVPKRGDFDTEYDNDMEKYLSDMEFLRDDTPEERRLKLDVIAIYNKTLNERQRRKDFIIDRELLLPCNRKRSREEREICPKVACFARFQTKEEHNVFIQGLVNEKLIRNRIEQLQEHRLLGIHTLIESSQYEMEKRKRESDKTFRKDKENLDYLYSTPRTATSVRRRRPGVDVDIDGSAKPIASLSSNSTPASSSWTLDRSLEEYSSLSQCEIDLCTKLRLLPKQFNAVKERIMQESFRRGLLDSDTPPKQFIRIDINKTDRIFDLFVSSGWESRITGASLLGGPDQNSNLR